jgi:hypothetical protein
MLSYLLLQLFHILSFRKLAADATRKWFVAHNLSNTLGVPLCHHSETVSTGEIWDSQSDIGRLKSCVMWCCVTGCVVSDGHVRNYSSSRKASYSRRLESSVQYFLRSNNFTVREIFVICMRIGLTHILIYSAFNRAIATIFCLFVIHRLIVPISQCLI